MICIGDSSCNYGLPNKANWLQRLERPRPVGAVREPHGVPRSWMHRQGRKPGPGSGRLEPSPLIACPGRRFEALMENKQPSAGPDVSLWGN